MSTKTGIEWTDETWNPTTGCDRVSPGCDNCYALSMARRLKGMGDAKYQTDGRPETSGPGFGVQCHPDVLEAPLRWRKPRKVFVNSMSDLFHPQVPNDFIVKVWLTMALAPQHTFQVLTKRPQRMRALLRDPKFDREVYHGLDEHTGGPYAQAALDLLCAWESGEPYLPNVWLGVSVEDQEHADQRIPLLLDTTAAVRFVSCEPLLGPVDLRCVAAAKVTNGRLGVDYLAPDGMHLDWVIVGGESGPGARPMDLAWARTIVEQCRMAGVACFVKQLGSRPAVTWCGEPIGRLPLRDRKGGDPDEWPLDLQVREFPGAVT